METLCASRACKRPPCGANSGFYFTATSIVLNLSTSSHATPIEFTHIDYHLSEDPSQKTVVDLGSRIPSLALDTTPAPERPRTKDQRPKVRGRRKTEVFGSTSSPLYAGRHVCPGFTRPCARFPNSNPQLETPLSYPENRRNTSAVRTNTSR